MFVGISLLPSTSLAGLCFSTVSAAVPSGPDILLLSQCHLPDIFDSCVNMDPGRPKLRVRIAKIDHIVTQATQLDNSPFPLAPITTVKRYIAHITNSLNHAIAVSMKRDPHSTKSQFIRAVVLVKGLHFYGFHSSHSPFLKIHIIDPAVVHRAVAILRSGTVMSTRFRVFESHLSFVLQFLCDFGLYGCGWIDLGDVWHRCHRDSDIYNTDEFQRAVSTFKPSPCFRQSRMSLEVDAIAAQILNRYMLSARDIQHLQSKAAQVDATEPLVLGVRELWDDERRRRLELGLPPSPEMPIDPSDRSRHRDWKWVAEARWWDGLKKRMEAERADIHQDDEKPWQKWVMTTFESVEALWEDEFKSWKPGGQEHVLGEEEVNPYQQATSSHSSCADGKSVIPGDPNTQDVVVDESLLSSQELSDFIEHEEAELEIYVDDQRDNDPEQELPDDALTEELDSEQDEICAPATDEDPESPTTPSVNRTLPKSTADLRGSPPHTKHASKSDWLETPLSRARNSNRHGTSLARPISGQQRQVMRKEHHALWRALEAARPENELVKSTATPDVETSRVDDTSFFEDEDRSANYLNGSSILRDDRFKPPRRQAGQQETTRSNKRRRIGTDLVVRFAVASADDSNTAQLTQVRRTASTQWHRLASSLARKPAGNAFFYKFPPPLPGNLSSTLETHGLPPAIYQDPYYSKVADAPAYLREYAGLVYDLRGHKDSDFLDDWEHNFGAEDGFAIDRFSFRVCESAGVGGWEYSVPPPPKRQMYKWLSCEQLSFRSHSNHPAVENAINPPPSVIPPRKRQDMTILSLDVFAPSRGALQPDPNIDEIAVLTYSFQSSNTLRDAKSQEMHHKSGIITMDDDLSRVPILRNCQVDVVKNEVELINSLIDKVLDMDPDIVVGWEIQSMSWGYLSARGRHIGLDIGDEISRAPQVLRGTPSEWDGRTSSTFRVAGRHVLNVWRIMRVELSLSLYTFENTAFNLLRRRIPKYTPSTLTGWYSSEVPYHKGTLLRYWLERTSTVLHILDAAETITKTAEFARVFGVDFSSVISRGSQFKVESFMFRIAKPESFVLLSPSKDDVGKQNAAECMPLIMEPRSAFYNGPVVVLDFQSLYPSLMIAYNYCYSTCLGRVIPFKGQNKLGVTDLHLQEGLLSSLQDHIRVAPNGIVYVKEEVRKGLLGRMLTELLETRVMVKQAMKGAKGNEVLLRILNARQLGLKYIANVTYGYTSASFSGRMPAVEIADSIVQSGRETLEKAIKYIETAGKWGAQVVYGDTDSLFIYLPGKTKQQAFRIGHDIAEAITLMNPSPVKLKFEKVYLPCVLMAKKRYVGFKYEHPDDTVPAFDAKGIETIRRDGVPAQQKMTENALRILFNTQDLSAIKDYCCRYWGDILDNKVCVQDFTFAREVKLGTYSDKVPPPPGVTVAARRAALDPNDEPQYGDRVPYVITRGEPNTRLVDRAVRPEELIGSRDKRLDSAYYISRVLIPPLERIFNLVGADVRAWFDDMPKRLRINPQETIQTSPQKSVLKADGRLAPNIDMHFSSFQCISCGAATSQGICTECRYMRQETAANLLSRIRVQEHRLQTAHEVCVSCTGLPPGEPIQCQSLECPWFYERREAESTLDDMVFIRDLAEEPDETNSEEDRKSSTEDEGRDSSVISLEYYGGDDIQS
ncbi:hypothetical protein EVG20_g1209 [Dentipellis fragilis]|uniref:DNA polymerase n=1 Tax=Dentipellis fragilis TaxID=205917 RepID=A0A4Y9ZAC2_9AGAM|nr:hypothetical protein EVG20_g1209 [Dentipellis fragilis]